MSVLDISFASGESSFSVRRFSVEEAISSLLAVSVWARSPDPSVDLTAIIGQPASFRLVSGFKFAFLGGARLWTGIVSHAEQVRALQPAAGQEGLSTYFVRIVPQLWLLTHRRGYRIFQHLSIPDIAGKLLSEWGIEPVWKIDRASYPPLEYKVQYGESDYAFFCRLLEEAGIAFTFPDDDQRGSRLTLTDHLEANPPRASPPLPFVDNPSRSAELEYITQVRLAHTVRPGALAMRDHDFRNPAFALFGEAKKALSPEDRYEQYRYFPGAFLVEGKQPGNTPAADDRGVARRDQAFGNDRADRALLGERAGREAIHFETNAVDLGPGTVFSIDGHPHSEITSKRPLLVTQFALEGSAEGEWTISGQAVFADVPYRPPLRTPKPIAYGVQSATVVGPAGQEIHTDEFGRVRVQFPWDREGTSDDTSSCWIRPSQGWGGRGYGMIVLPRIGQEVLVTFEGGDPDQPVLGGRLFNAINPVPYALPENKTISTWKSHSSPGGGGFNEIKFEDKKGDELFYVQAEKNLRKLVKNNETITVLRHRDKQVGVNETDTTGANRTEVTGANRSETTGANRTTVVGQTRRKLVKKDETFRTEGNHKRLVGKNQDVVVKGARKKLVEVDMHLIVRGDRAEKIDGDQSLTVQSQHENVTGNHALEASKQIHLASGEIIVGEAASDATLKGPGGFIRIDAGGVTIKGTLVQINVGGSAGKGKGSKPKLPEEPKEAPTSTPVITSRTVSAAPSSRTRTRIGVGEEVTLTFSPGSATWTTSGGGTLTPTSGSSVTFRAGDRAATATITATGSGTTLTITLQVIEPSSFVMERAPGTGIRHTHDRPDCGFKGKMFLQPTDVSFENIDVRELNSTSTASGFYTPFHNITHQPASQTASAWFTVNAPTGGKGSSPNMQDQIYSGDPGGGPPFSAGSLVFPCTWEFKVGSGSPKAITTVQHAQQVDTAGKCDISKAGASASRVPSDPTSSW